MAFRKTIKPSGLGWFCEGKDHKSIAKLVLAARKIFSDQYGHDIPANDLVEMILMAAVRLEDKVDLVVLSSNSDTELQADRFIFQQSITHEESEEVYRRFDEDLKIN